MPVRKRFWEKPEEAPLHLDTFPKSAVGSAHHSSYFSAPYKIREGISPDALDYFTFVTHPLEGYSRISQEAGPIRFLLSREAPVQSHFPKNEVASRYISAIILPRKYEYGFNFWLNEKKYRKETFKAAKKKGIPVFSSDGDRLWPPKKMAPSTPAPERFWENPQDAPPNLRLFESRMRYAHHAGISKAASIVRQGLLSKNSRLRLARKPRSISLEAENIWLMPAYTPLDAYNHPRRMGPVRFLISGVNVERSIDPLNEFDEVVAKKQIHPRHIEAIIIPEPNKIFLSLLKAAEKKQIPVYLQTGERFWPEVKK